MLATARHPNHIAMSAAGAGGAIGKAKGNYGYFGVFNPSRLVIPAASKDTLSPDQRVSK